ncbi:hypothetical protein [Candidatus Phytoplasma bonamiae]|uniref:Effector n=1 Tax=Candidatus Phytoplasma bonamiae TaxID=2982626 RepID=A0ABT9D3S1_9MOLU|nr:hypothetical protein ['Bonamia sp.' little leaf phytoplasma]MDO8064054.1 hypothetical protein ['Bonamia sp.' little leaf phytoplasma]
MNKQNFWSKYFVTIRIILLLGIAMMILMNQNYYITNQIPTPLSASKSEEETLKSEKLLSPSAIKSPKTTISPKIKTYFFTEPVDLLEREKEEIVELKKSRPSSLDLLKDSKNPINEYQHQYDEHQSQLNALLPFQIAFVK